MIQSLLLQRYTNNYLVDIIVIVFCCFCHAHNIIVIIVH